MFRDWLHWLLILLISATGGIFRGDLHSAWPCIKLPSDQDLFKGLMEFSLLKRYTVWITFFFFFFFNSKHTDWKKIPRKCLAPQNVKPEGGLGKCTCLWPVWMCPGRKIYTNEIYNEWKSFLYQVLLKGMWWCWWRFSVIQIMVILKCCFLGNWTFSFNVVVNHWEPTNWIGGGFFSTCVRPQRQKEIL